MSKINWDKISEANLLILKLNEISHFKFLNNGLETESEIFDDKTKKLKKITKYIFEVSDFKDNDTKELSIIQSRLMNKLKIYQPLKNKEFKIRKKQIGITEYDIDFDVEFIK